MAAYEVLLLNTAIPQIQAAQAGDSYVVPRDIAINATAIISANSATDALRITQTGAGNALVVEDSANPDATPFVVTAAGDVGIGTTSPGYKLEVNGVGGVNTSNANAAEFHVKNTSASARDWVLLSTGSAWAGGGQTGYFNIYDNTAGQQRLTIDTSGNLGLGVTPSAWSGIGTTLQVNTGGSFSADAANAYFAANSYYNGTNWIYQTTNNATRYTMATNSHIWYTAASGTAGNAITFTQVLTLDGIDGSGYGKNLKLGGTADRATTKGTHHFDIFDGTAPVGTLANGISLYSSSGEAYVMDAAGNATLFSPHDSETNEWIFKSKHTPSGKVLKIDVEKMLRFINDHFGLDAIHEFTEE